MRNSGKNYQIREIKKSEYSLLEEFLSYSRQNTPISKRTMNAV